MFNHFRRQRGGHRIGNHLAKFVIGGGRFQVGQGAGDGVRNQRFDFRRSGGRRQPAYGVGDLKLHFRRRRHVSGGFSHNPPDFRLIDGGGLRRRRSGAVAPAGYRQGQRQDYGDAGEANPPKGAVYPGGTDGGGDGAERRGEQVLRGSQ